MGDLIAFVSGLLVTLCIIEGTTYLGNYLNIPPPPFWGYGITGGTLIVSVSLGYSITQTPTGAIAGLVGFLAGMLLHAGAEAIRSL